MIKVSDKKKLSDFIDGELSAAEHDALFSNPDTASEKREYLQTLRFIKRGASELVEKAPDRLKASTVDAFVRTSKMKKKSRAFSAVWIVLTVLLVLWIAFAVAFLTGFFEDGFLPESNGGVTSSEATSSIPPVSSESSSNTPSEEPASSDVENSTPLDYSTYLPYGIDEYLSQEYRGEKFAYVLVCRGKAISVMKDNKAHYTLIYKDAVNEFSPEGVTVFSTDLLAEDVKQTLLQNGFIGFEEVNDDKFEGISKNAEKGIVFVRFLDI